MIPILLSVGIPFAAISIFMRTTSSTTYLSLSNMFLMFYGTIRKCKFVQTLFYKLLANISRHKTKCIPTKILLYFSILLPSITYKSRKARSRGASNIAISLIALQIRSEKGKERKERGKKIPS